MLRNHADNGKLEMFSAYTVIMYLNDDFDGGWTTFYETEGKSSRKKLTIIDGKIEEAGRWNPQAGDILIFPHARRCTKCEPSPLHDGSIIHSGEKLIIRTDLNAVPRKLK